MGEEKKIRVLVIDDDECLLDVVKDMLESKGYEVDCVETAKQAVESLKTSNYAYILVDYRMPGNDGIWFMENATIPKKTKALLMTAYLNRDVINRMFELGASGYIIKPFDLDELLTHLNFHAK